MHNGASNVIKEIKSFKFKTLLRFQFWAKNIETFLNNSKPPERCSKYFCYQISQLFVDLFARNMNGWWDNSNLVCWAMKLCWEKTRKQKNYLGSRSWCKYFPNIFFTIFIWKYFLKIFGAWPWFFLCAIQLVPKVTIACIVLKL